ncbi:MAG: methyl-accepting chemotaxis protein [Usitatibacter sp.]
MLKDLSLRDGLKVIALAAAIVFVVLGVAAYSTVATLADALNAADAVAVAKAKERIVTAVLLGLGALGLCAWWLHGHFNRRVGQLVTATEIFSAGDCDLTRRLPTMSGAFGRVCSSLNGFVVQIHDLVTNVARNAGEIARAARQVSEDNNHLSSRTHQQSSTLKEAASSMEAFTRSVKRNADDARLASQLASSASATARDGGAVVSQAVAMINAANEGSRKIGAIVSTIDSLAFQTNILALNAAVEAARAGDQGRGFAVVAAEVRALAQRCAAAAKEIKGMVSVAIEQVDEGARLADKAGSSMLDIVVAIQQASEIMGQINDAASEQASGIEDVNRALGQMREESRHNAALVEQGAAAAQAMREQAEELSDGVARFKLA